MSSWIAIVVAVVSAAGAIAAAIVAARSAAKTKQAELQAARLLDAEKRLSGLRAEVFEPLVEAIGRLWDAISKKQKIDAQAFDQIAGNDIRRFTQWVQIYGSDEALEAALRFMQATYNPPPEMVLVRLLGELVVAARRELGYPDTRIGALEVLAMRISDAYTNSAYRADLTDPLEIVFARNGWTPPWALSLEAERDASREQ